jgi:cell division septation protein DedD
MNDRIDPRHDEKGISARYLILVFLMGVAACAVFFSLGFLVGYNERPTKSVSTTEQVTPVGVVPPAVNPPLDSAPPVAKPEPAASGNELSAEKTASPQPASKPPKEEATLVKPAPSPARTSARSAPVRTSRRGAEAGGVGFTVQVAASRDKQDAEKLVKELRSRGVDVFVVTPQYSDAKDNLYRVQVGPFASREEAVRVRDRIAKEGFKPFIKH